MGGRRDRKRGKEGGGVEGEERGGVEGKRHEREGSEAKMYAY